MAEFNEWIARYRKRKGLEPKNCADAAGVSIQYWWKLENVASSRSNGKPTQRKPETLDRIAKGLEIDVGSIDYFRLYDAAGVRPDESIPRPDVLWQEEIRGPSNDAHSGITYRPNEGITGGPETLAPTEMDLIEAASAVAANPQIPDSVKQAHAEILRAMIPKSTLRVVEGGQYQELTREPIDAPEPRQEKKAAARGEQGPKPEREAAEAANEDAMKKQDEFLDSKLVKRPDSQ